MDDIQQQKSQIDEQARLAKEAVDANAVLERQALADQESARITSEAADKAAQIQNDAQK
jgi:hypothetical protein